MPLMDEFREERAALRSGTPKQKLQYFMDYYKWPAVVILFVLIFAISMIRHIVSNKETAFLAVFLNCYTTEELSDAFIASFAENAGLDARRYAITIDSTLSLSDNYYERESYATLQKMTVYIAAREIDILAAETASFCYYAYLDALTDLRKLLSPTQQALYEPYYFYIDQKFLEKLRDEKINLDEAMTEYPDPTKPEEMEEPIPVGIYINECERLENSFAFGTKPTVIGVISNSPRQETALQFIDFLFQD